MKEELVGCQVYNFIGFLLYYSQCRTRWFILCGMMLLRANLVYVKIEMKGGLGWGEKGEEKLKGRKL